MLYSNVPPVKLNVKVIEKKTIAPHVLVVTVDGNGNKLPIFTAGQYYSFRIADRVNRSYSIASAPSTDTAEFLIDTAPGGPGSLFAEELEVRDIFEVLGPLGFFTLEKTHAYEDENPIIFVATGTGIAPFRSMILDLLVNKKSTRDIYLYFGLRYDTESYYFDEFADLAGKYPNFHNHPIISRPSENWKGEVGHCQDFITQMPVLDGARIYICGQNKNVDAIAEDLKAYGYPKESLHFEKYG